MRFAILGPVEARDGDHRLPLGGPQQVALLTFLLLQRNRPVSSDRLHDALWAGQDAAGASKRVQVAIARLRRGLAALEERGAVVQTVGGGYLLAVAAGELDAQVFESGVAEGLGLLDGGDAAAASLVLRDALALWRGPAMAQVAFADFAQPEIRRLEELRLTAREGYFDAELMLGRHRDAIGELQALVDEHPERERLCEQLMLALYRSGRQAGALAAYARLSTHLSDELGLRPRLALQALQRDILDQAASLDARTVAVAAAPPSVVEQQRPVRLRSMLGASGAANAVALESGFVGRDEELRRASEALDVVAAGGARAIAVAGDAGIGKSRLLAEIATMATARGQLVLTGRAAEFERDLPFGLFVDALDDHLRMLAPDKVQRLGAELQSGLAQLFPAFAGLGGDGAPLLNNERYRAHRAVRDLLERLAAARPLVLLFDDLHWVDHASVELLSALLRRPPCAAVLIVVSLRPRQADPLLRSVLDHAAHAGLLLRLDLQTLTFEDSRSLLSSRVAPGTLDALYAQAGGNPFFLEELARSMSRTATPSAGHADGGLLDAAGLPPAVTAALAQELSVPGAEARWLLRGAAVTGDPFELELAAAAAEMSEDGALAALDELVALDLVRHTDVPRRMCFRHPLLRLAVYDATPAGWRLRAHERTARALGARGSGPAARAHHVEQSARVGDLDAVALLSEAGMAAAKRAPASAARWFSAALRLLPGEGAAAEQRVGLLVMLADALVAVGRLEDGRAVVLELLEVVPAEPTALRVRLVGACAKVEHLLGRHREAHDRLRSEFARLPDEGSATAAELLAELAVNRFFESDPEQMRHHAEAALTTAHALEDRPLVTLATALAAAACALVADAPHGRAHADEAAQLVDAMADTDLGERLESICYLAWSELILERFEACVRHTARAIAVSRACGRGEFLPQLLQSQGQALARSGRLVEAIDVAERAVEAARLTTNTHSIVWALQSHTLALQSRDAEAALHVARESVERMRGQEESVICTLVNVQYARALAATGEHARCAELLVEAGGGLDLPLVPVSWRAQELEALAHAELARDRPRAAANAARQALAVSERLGLPSQTASAQRAQAAVLLAEGKPDEAAEVALASAVAAGSVGARIEEGLSRAIAGRALLAAGDRERAIAQSQAAAALFESCGAVCLHEEVERELRRLGRPYRRRAGHGDGGSRALSAREREIAELVGARRTNREIAAEMFLSEQTVESHVRNIFGKLGVASRRSVAEALRY